MFEPRSFPPSLLSTRRPRRNSDGNDASARGTVDIDRSILPRKRFRRRASVRRFDFSGDTSEISQSPLRSLSYTHFDEEKSLLRLGAVSSLQGSSLGEQRRLGPIASHINIYIRRRHGFNGMVVCGRSSIACIYCVPAAAFT